MLKHAPQLGEIHKQMVLRNPKLKKKYEQGYNRFVKKLRINSPSRKATAFLSQKYQYPPEFIDRTTGKPYYLYQFCPIAVYWSVDITGGFKTLFSRSVISEINLWYWIPKFDPKIWHETDWASAEKIQANLHWHEGQYTTAQGQTKTYKRAPQLEDRYLTYNIKSNTVVGQNMKVKRIARNNVTDAYKKWFQKNKKRLSGEDPSLSIAIKDTIKPKYSQLKMGKLTYSVMDPVWNLGITIRALYALMQLIRRRFQTPSGKSDMNVTNIKRNEFYKTYITDINKNLPKDNQINFDMATDSTKTADAYIRENVKYLKEKSNIFNGIFRPALLTLESLLEQEGNSVISVPEEMREALGKQYMSLSNWIKQSSDLAWYIEYVISESDAPNGIAIRITDLSPKDLMLLMFPKENYINYARELGKPNPTIIQNATFLIFNDGKAYFPLSTSSKPYTNKNLNDIFITMEYTYTTAFKTEAEIQSV